MTTRARATATLLILSSMAAQAQTSPPEPNKLSEKVSAAERALNLAPVPAEAPAGDQPKIRTRGLTRSFTAPPAAAPEAQSLSGGVRLRGFSRTRGGLPPALEDYSPLSTKDTGKIAPAAQGSGQLVQAAQVESVQPRVDAKSHAQFDQIQFDYNSADFANPAQALDNLEVVAEVMKRNPQARLVICGHTCDLGEAGYNQLLSCLRANKVYAWLVEKGIDESRLDPIGFGEAHPARVVDPAATSLQQEADRRANRRVYFRTRVE